MYMASESEMNRQKGDTYNVSSAYDYGPVHRP